MFYLGPGWLRLDSVGAFHVEFDDLVGKTADGVVEHHETPCEKRRQM
jgi:hypothetical protein